MVDQVAILSPGELFGGVERQVLDLCRYYGEQENPRPLPVVFHDAELAQRLREAGLEPVVLRGRSRYDPGLVGRLQRLLEAAGVRLLHVHGYKATVLAALLRRRYRCAVVKTVHGRPEPVGRRPLAAAKTFLNHRLDNLATTRGVDIACYVTADLRRRFAGEHTGCRARVVPNGIRPLDGRGFARPAELDPGAVNAGIVGRVTPVKGIDLALAALADSVRDQRVVLHVVGDGPQRAELRRLAEHLGVSHRVRFHGFRRDAHAFLAHLDIVLMPSRHEGLPYTLLEAMSLARAVAVSDGGGLPEVVEDGRTGLVFPVEDVKAMGAVLDALAASAGLRRRLGEAARSVQVERYSLARMAGTYREVYAEAMEGMP